MEKTIKSLLIGGLLFSLALTTTVGLKFFRSELDSKKIEIGSISREPLEPIEAKLPDLNITIDTTDKIPVKWHIFFDLRQLLQSSSSGAAKAIGVSNIFWYSVKHKRKPDHLELQARLFKFMDHCTKVPRGCARFNDELLPNLMCQWICGQLKTAQLIDQVLRFKIEAKEFFESEEEQNLVLGILDLFRPQTLASLQKPQPKMIKVFEDCCQKFPNQVYILSNWDAESAKLVRQKFPQIFNKISPDHILLSGETGYIKPNPEAYTYITKKLNLNPKNCILIDDCRESIATAKSLGWKTILHNEAQRTAKRLKGVLLNANKL